jgi:hypothetical protein
MFRMIHDCHDLRDPVCELRFRLLHDCSRKTRTKLAHQNMGLAAEQYRADASFGCGHQNHAEARAPGCVADRFARAARAIPRWSHSEHRVSRLIEAA